MTESLDTPDAAGERPDSNARAGAFTDAAVAIAMTLLILPLMEGVSEAGRSGQSAGQYVTENVQALSSFVLSFVLVGMFWLQHHRSFRAETPFVGASRWLNLLWLLCIVALPVTTAMSGVFGSDRVALALYEGNLAACSWALYALVRAQNAVRVGSGLEPLPARAARTPLAMSLMFTAVFLVTLAVPAIGYYGLFAMVLAAPVARLLNRLEARKDPRR